MVGLGARQKGLFAAIKETIKEAKFSHKFADDCGTADTDTILPY